MIQEEESLKKRLITSIEACRAEMEKLYLELQLPVFEVKAMKLIPLFPLRAQSDLFKTAVVITADEQIFTFELLFQEEKGISMLQQEKNLRIQVQALMKEKANRMQQLKTLLEQEQDLCDILCSMPYGIAADCVPSVEQLENFQQHIQNQNEEKVEGNMFDFLPNLGQSAKINQVKLNTEEFSHFSWFIDGNHSPF